MIKMGNKASGETFDETFDDFSYVQLVNDYKVNITNYIKKTYNLNDDKVEKLSESLSKSMYNKAADYYYNHWESSQDILGPGGNYPKRLKSAINKIPEYNTTVTKEYIKDLLDDLATHSYEYGMSTERYYLSKETKYVVVNYYINTHKKEFLEAIAEETQGAVSTIKYSDAYAPELRF